MRHQPCSHLSFKRSRHQGDAPSEQSVFHAAILSHSYSGQAINSPWDELHLAYFNSYALWTYLTVPVLYTFPGFETAELSAWREDGETWPPLRVSFPNGIASHGQEQISYFGPDGLLTRTSSFFDARHQFFS
jgi:hypothetical protein